MTHCALCLSGVFCLCFVGSFGFKLSMDSPARFCLNDGVSPCTMWYVLASYLPWWVGGKREGEGGENMGGCACTL